MSIFMFSKRVGFVINLFVILFTGAGAWSRGVPGRGERLPAPGGVPGPRGGCLLLGGDGVAASGGGAWWRSPGRLLLRAVRILLECILVQNLIVV